jgi:hypothetical protein
MTPNERESGERWGTITTKLEQVAHKQRSTTMILDSVIEEAHQIKTEIANLKAEIARQRTMLRTALSVLAITIAALAWVVELVLS